jgi:hypothetical protein
LGITAPMTHQQLRHPYNVDYVINMLRAVYDDRINFIDGTRIFVPGIELHRIGAQNVQLLDDTPNSSFPSWLGGR